MIYLPFFESSDHLKQFQSYLNSKISITIQTEQNSKASFLDVSFIHEQCKFTTRIYWKPTFSGVYTHFDSFLPNIFKIGMNYALVNRYFWICSNWSMSYSQVRLNKNVLEKQLYSKNFIDICFQLFLNRIHIQKEKTPAGIKKPLSLVLPFLETISLQILTELQSAS